MKRRQLLKAPLLGVGAASFGTLGVSAINAASAQGTASDTVKSTDTQWVETEGWMVSPDAKRAHLERQLARIQAELNQAQGELSSAKRTIETLEAESERSWTEKLKNLF